MLGISLPCTEKNQKKIKFFDGNMHEKRRGFGAVNLMVTIGNNTSETSIYLDSKLSAYRPSVKVEMRKKEKIVVGSEMKVGLKFNT